MKVLAIGDSGAGTVGVLGIFGVLSILINLLPTVIAGLRGHHNIGAIFFLNLLLRWTLLAWVFALVWSATVTDRQRLQQIQTSQRQPDLGRRNPMDGLNVGEQTALAQLGQRGRYHLRLL
jgi:hypothetical protein